MSGSTLMVYGLRQARQKPGLIVSALFTFFGGFAGSVLAIPFGISMSRNELRSVEDPQHLARALHDALDQRKSASNLLRTASDTSAPTRDTMEMPTPSSDWSTVEQAQEPVQPAEGGTSGSRWEQLRRDRTSSSSVWEQIRQDNARSMLPEQNRRSSRPDATGASTRQSQGSSDYERAVKEYEAAMERERQGIDVTTGFAEKEKVWH